MAKPKHNQDKVDQKQTAAGQTKDVKAPIAKESEISEAAARREAADKMTDRNYD